MREKLSKINKRTGLNKVRTGGNFDMKKINVHFFHYYTFIFNLGERL